MAEKQQYKQSKEVMIVSHSVCTVHPTLGNY